jgi:hypothetical protein
MSNTRVPRNVTGTGGEVWATLVSTAPVAAGSAGGEAGAAAGAVAAAFGGAGDGNCTEDAAAALASDAAAAACWPYAGDVAADHVIAAIVIRHDHCAMRRRIP